LAFVFHFLQIKAREFLFQSVSPFPLIFAIRFTRRKFSPFRRKTDTYAKSVNSLQRVLNVYQVVHNFIRVHFTTKEVSAVALGVMQDKLSVEYLLNIQFV